jgi:CheY-like chemotaxis protein
MKRVLIIDDDQFVLKVYQSKFEADGIRAEVAADPIAALTQVRANVPDLILLDLMLPGMNGVDVLRQIRTIPGAEGVPVLVFTHSYDSALIEQAKAGGADVVLNKNNVSPNRLMEMVRHALAQGRRQALPVASDSGAAPKREGAGAVPEKQFVRGDLRASLMHQASAIEGQLRALVQNFVGAPDGTQRMAALAQLNNKLGDIILDAVDADLFDIMMMGRALSRMIVDLEQHPEEISQGTVRSFGTAVITIANLYRRIGSAPKEHELPGLAVIVIPNPQAGRLIAGAFVEVGFPAVSFSTTEAAGSFVAENPASIIVVSEQWPAGTGEEFFLRCSRADGRQNLRALYLSQEQTPPNHTVSADTPPTLYLPYTAEEVVVNSLARFYFRK